MRNDVLVIAPVAFSQEREMLLVCVEDAQILKLLQRDLHDLSVDIESLTTSSTLTTTSNASLGVQGSYTSNQAVVILESDRRFRESLSA